MKVIGILGGMGSYATLDLFRRILEAFPVEKEWERPRVIIDNNCTMPSRVRAILYDEKKEQLISEMSDSIQQLVQSGATQIILGCITAHYFLEYLPHKEYIINVLEETSKYIAAGDILVLCTEGSKQVDIWNQVLKQCNIIYPNEMQMIQLREFIEIVKQGKITVQSQQDFVEFLHSFSCDRILLGCTELPVLLGNCNTQKKVIDPLQYAITCLTREEK